MISLSREGKGGGQRPCPPVKKRKGWDYHLESTCFTRTPAPILGTRKRGGAAAGSRGGRRGELLQRIPRGGGKGGESPPSGSGENEHHLGEKRKGGGKLDCRSGQRMRDCGLQKKGEKGRWEGGGGLLPEPEGDIRTFMLQKEEKDRGKT